MTLSLLVKVSHFGITPKWLTTPFASTRVSSRVVESCGAYLQWKPLNMETWLCAKMFGLITLKFKALYFLCQPPTIPFPFFYQRWWPTLWHAHRYSLQSSVFIELSVCFETNLDNNVRGTPAKYRSLLIDPSPKYRQAAYFNFVMGSLGIFQQSCDSFIQMCSNLAINQRHINYMVTKQADTIIRTTYCNFCRCNEPLTTPNLLSY